MPKILTLDIETAPIEAYTWGIWEQNIGVDMVKTDWSILAYAAKWLGHSRTIYEDTSGRGIKAVRDDYKLLKGLRDILDEADLVIAQNGIRFDIKKINSRLITAGITPYSPIRVIDTLSVAKKHFGFTSNKLAWTSKYLTDTPKSNHRRFPGFELWQECLADNPAAWREMKKYNIQDVVATEKLYIKMRPWIANHPNVNTYANREEEHCPKCSSVNIQARGYAVLQKGRYPRFQCNDCGGWSRGTTMVNTLKVRKVLLS